jgi:hypothetical protein
VRTVPWLQAGGLEALGDREGRFEAASEAARRGLGGREGLVEGLFAGLGGRAGLGLRQRLPGLARPQLVVRPAPGAVAAAEDGGPACVRNEGRLPFVTVVCFTYRNPPYERE